MDVTRLKASEPVELITSALQEEGAVIVEELLPPDLLDRFNAELDPFVEAANPETRKYPNEAIKWFMGRQTRDVTGIAGKSRVFATEILVHPVYRAVCEAILRPSCSRYHLNVAHVLDRGPGSEPQVLHRDEGVWPHLPKPHPDVQLASVIALVDFTAENGATRVVPGSHRWPAERRPEDHEVVAAEMPAGAAVIYLGSTLHGGGANVTPDQFRRGMHVSYCLGWLRTEENQYLATPIEVARTLPRESLEMLGYAMHDAIEIGAGFLGAVELHDPIDLIANGGL